MNRFSALRACSGATRPGRRRPWACCPRQLDTGVLTRLGCVLVPLASLACSKASDPPFSTTPTSPAVVVTPNYTLTLTASPRCAMVTDWASHQPLPFPDSARVRRYDTQFTGSSLSVISANGTAGPFDARTSGNTFTAVVPPSADDLTRRDASAVWVEALRTQAPSCAGGDYWVDDFGDDVGPDGRHTEHFEMCGTWHATIEDPPRIAGTIDGAFVYYKGTGPNFSTDLYCRASDHQFSLTKR